MEVESPPAPFVARPLAAYVRELRPALPAEAFERSLSRVLLVPLHYGVIAIAAVAITKGWGGWPVAVLLSGLIGLCVARLAFVGHEAQHGAIVSDRRARLVLGWFAFLPFTLSPRLWDAWHGRVHHANANTPGADPDMFPTLAEYRTNRRARLFIDHFAIGSGRLRGLLSVLFGFTGQSLLVLITAQKTGTLTRRAHRLAILETALGVAVWATVAALIGFVPFLLVFVVPLIIGNTVMMAFILTNHSLSPLTEVNDPLINSLSVTGPRWMDWATLHFGLHVEHHLFPSMSSRHSPKVRDLLRAKWPERYQSMPLWRALLALHRSPRVYKDAVTLIDPKTGAEFPTLLPGRMER